MKQRVAIDAILQVLNMAAEKPISFWQGSRHLGDPLKVYTKMIQLGLLEEYIGKRSGEIPTIYYRLTTKGQQALSVFRE